MSNWFCRRCRSILQIEYRRSADALGLYRIAFAAFYLFLDGIPRFGWIARAPAAFFDPPPGPARLLPGFPPAAVLETLDLTLLLLFVALLLGTRTRAVSIGITALLMFGNLFRYSFGKIDHDILFVLAPLLFAGSWGRSFSLDARRAARSDPAAGASSLAPLAGLISFGFLTAGLPKLERWVDFDLSTHGVKSWVLNAVHLGRTEYLVPYFASLDAPLAWELLDLAAVAFETGFVVALFLGPRWFHLWIGLAVLFHLSNFLMLNIPFTMHLALYLGFADWEAAARRALTAGAFPFNLASRRVALGAGLAYLTLLVVAARLEAPQPSLLDHLHLVAPIGKSKPLVILVAAALTAVTLGARSLRRDRTAAPVRDPETDPR